MTEINEQPPLFCYPYFFLQENLLRVYGQKSLSWRKMKLC